MDPAASETRKPSPFVFGVLATAFAAVLMHVRSLGAPFFADDWLFLDQVRFRSLFQVLASPDPLGNYFRPLGRQLWFWGLANLSAESPLWFHAANLACFTLAVVLLGLIARRLAGPLAGIVAASYLALHYAADVPVLWVSGSQELLSLTLALAALHLYLRGQRVLAAVPLLLALLAKEVVVLLPLAALALDDVPGGLRVRVRRALPLFGAVLVWAVLAWIATSRRGTAGAGLALTPLGPAAVPLLLVRVALGLEWQAGRLPFASFVDPGPGAWLALLAVGIALGFVVPAARAPARGARTTKRPGASDRRAVAPVATTRNAVEQAGGAQRAWRGGLVWAVVGALPVAAVAPQWSAYYFLFALAGLALALGAFAAQRRWGLPLSFAVLLVTGVASGQASGLQEFATSLSPWSGQSHVNRFYLERGMNVITRCVRDLRAQMPEAPPRTTVFVAGLPSFAAFQVADGPLIRGVYRDSTLRGYYLSQFTRDKMDRGPWRVFFFDQGSGKLVDQTHTRGVFISSALGQIMNGKLDVAEAALEAARLNGEDDLGRPYLSGVVALGMGQRELAVERFAQAAYQVGGDGAGLLRETRRNMAAGDTAEALRTVRRAIAVDVLNPDVHALAADLMLSRVRTLPDGQVEAYVTRLLAPQTPSAARRWAFVLAYENRTSEAIAELDRYRRLAPHATELDRDAVKLRTVLVRMLPGGDLAQKAMKKELTR
ncbi:MAG: hypothetical protein ABL977_09060 [Candidatus Eisenbacteria bacterium]